MQTYVNLHEYFIVFDFFKIDSKRQKKQFLSKKINFCYILKLFFKNNID